MDFDYLNPTAALTILNGYASLLSHATCANFFEGILSHTYTIHTYYYKRIHRREELTSQDDIALNAFKASQITQANRIHAQFTSPWVVRFYRS